MHSTGITHWQSPSFFAYFSANSSPPALLGEMLSGAPPTQLAWSHCPHAWQGLARYRGDSHLTARRRLEHNRLQLDNVAGLHRAGDGARLSVPGGSLACLQHALLSLAPAA